VLEQVAKGFGGAADPLQGQPAHRRFIGGVVGPRGTFGQGLLDGVLNLKITQGLPRAMSGFVRFPPGIDRAVFLLQLARGRSTLVNLAPQATVSEMSTSVNRVPQVTVSEMVSFLII
jgi:hypothetical protein